jgi:hypothetical protein
MHSIPTYLPLVTIRKKFFLVVNEFLVGLRGILKVGTLHNGVHGTRLLTKATVNALLFQ